MVGEDEGVAAREEEDTVAEDVGRGIREAAGEDEGGSPSREAEAFIIRRDLGSGILLPEEVEAAEEGEGMVADYNVDGTVYE